MTLPQDSPHRGPSRHLNEAFGAWWVTLNGIGILAFEMFLECQGSDENRHALALACSVVIGWLLYVSKRAFPRILRRLRLSLYTDDQVLEREILRDYLGVIKMPVLYLPYFIGLVSLGTLALSPVVTLSWTLWLPSFAR